MFGGLLALLIVLFVAALADSIAAWLGDNSQGFKRHLRRGVLALSVIALVWTAGAVILAGFFPTTEKFPPGSHPAMEWLKAISEGVVALFPLWAALTRSLFFMRSTDNPRLRFDRAALLVVFLIPVDVFLSVWVGCNLAGACL